MSISLLGLTVAGWCHSFNPKLIFTYPRQLLTLDRLMLILMLLVGITGALLVHPNSFTFTSTWVRAASELLTVAFAFLYVQTLVRSFKLKDQATIPTKLRLLFLSNYSLLIILLVLSIYHVVSKQSLLF